MSKIDNQMYKMFESYTEGSSDQGKKVSVEETGQLIKRAEQVNNSGTSSFRKKAAKGKESLQALITEYPAAFSSDSQKAIQNYLKYSQLPAAGTRPQLSYGRSTTSIDPTRVGAGLGNGPATGLGSSTPSTCHNGTSSGGARNARSSNDITYGHAKSTG